MQINTIFLNMDVQVTEQTVSNADGSYTILLNARHTMENQRKAYMHAVKHIRDNDFEKTDADAIEHAAHEL